MEIPGNLPRLGVDGRVEKSNVGHELLSVVEGKVFYDGAHAAEFHVEGSSPAWEPWQHPVS